MSLSLSLSFSLSLSLPVVCPPSLLPGVGLEGSEVKELVPGSVSAAGPLAVAGEGRGPEEDLRAPSRHALSDTQEDVY